MKSDNRLEQLAEFESVLKHYAPSQDAKDFLETIQLVLLVGPTAAGRNTLINLLIETDRYHYIVSDTTRHPRYNNGILEQNGVEYWFKSEADFLKGLKSGDYLEAAVIHGQQVSGISVAELRRAGKSGKIAVDEIEVEGARNIYKYKPDATFVFLLPPTFDIWMERLRGRGEMKHDELLRRVKSAYQEIETALEAGFYQFVVNNEIHDAAVAVDELANGRKIDEERHLLGRNHAEQLAIDIQLYLKSEKSD